MEHVTNSPGSVSPGRLRNLDGVYSHEQALECIRELEEEFAEFTKVYKNIELELEQELADAALEQERLRELVLAKDRQVQALSIELQGLTVELNALTKKQQQTTETLRHNLESNLAKLTTVEILNDTFENNERRIKSQLDHLREANNDLLEQNAILENDLMLQRELVISEKLARANDSITLNDLRQQITQLKHASLRRVSGRQGGVTVAVLGAADPSLPVAAAPPMDPSKGRGLALTPVNGKKPTALGGSGDARPVPPITKVSRHTTLPVKTKDRTTYIPGESPDTSFVSPPVRNPTMVKSSSMKQLHEMIAKQESATSRFKKFKRFFSTKGALSREASPHQSRLALSNAQHPHKKSPYRHTLHASTSQLLVKAEPHAFKKLSSSVTLHQSLSARRDVHMLLAAELMPTIEGSPIPSATNRRLVSLAGPSKGKNLLEALRQA